MSPDSTDFEAMISPVCFKHGEEKPKFKYRYDKEGKYEKYCPKCEKNIFKYSQAKKEKNMQEERT